jgi:outer membrane protein OmpA-like peptidoglycan-associated protein
MAPTVNALIAQLPNKKGAAQAADTDKAASTVKGLLDKANNVADAMKSDDKNAGPGAPQGEKTAAQLEKEKAKDKMKANAAKTKDVALSMAASLIQKNDADGSKSAEALAQLGKVSTVFADVATKVTDGAITASPGSSAQYDISAGGGAHGAASKRLEGDVLESQGNSGYDPMEAVRRELDEAAGGATKTTISTSTDPNAPKSQATVQALAGAAGLGGAQGRVGRASGTGGAMVKDAEALAMSSLPAAFSSAARRTTGQGTTNPTASHGGNERLSCFVLSMRGDLLFDFNSAELRSDSATALAQVAQVVTEHPNLPLLVRGYTDSKGGYEANEALSRRRAEAVRDWIMAKTGIKAQKITVQGLGSTEPVAPNEYVDGSDNPGGREKNRRVTVTIPRDQVEQ